MQKRKRCFTIMIIPHSEESTYSLRLPLLVGQLVVALLFVGVIGISVLGYSYLNAVSGAREAEHLRQINRAQQEEINALAIETQKMMEQMHEIDLLVELVTEKLELEPAELNNGQEQSRPPVEGGNQFDSDREEPVEEQSSTNGLLDRASYNVILLSQVMPEQTDLLDALGDQVVRAKAMPSIWPARGRISSGFGMRPIPYSSRGYQFHSGVDIIGAYGTDVRATADGKVTFSGYRGSLGNLLIIDHGYGYETWYAHLAGFNVSTGDSVSRGDLIGFMGASGRTTGTHLHYEVHLEGVPVNPYHYMQK